MAATLDVVTSIFLLDSEGSRITAKFYSGDLQTLEQQKEIEKKIFKASQTSTSSSGADVVMLDHHLGIFRVSNGCLFAITGALDQNELMLEYVLEAFVTSVQAILRGQTDKRTILENLDYVILIIDELIDDGVILETEPDVLISRVSLRPSEGDVPLAEQTLVQAIQSARDQIQRSLLQ
eukprot:TRINITY_DN5467_c0_g1_i1.p1 TRINITY_DN5467_c0_g1~~TRINITY_DN5467_c0_g1_i1.p1  ORF type:complete len:179 (-),score=78.39 TRINITY_DN5467_c0_g1_i1:45-581(-)